MRPPIRQMPKVPRHRHNSQNILSESQRSRNLNHHFRQICSLRTFRKIRISSHCGNCRNSGICGNPHRTTAHIQRQSRQPPPRLPQTDCHLRQLCSGCRHPPARHNDGALLLYASHQRHLRPQDSIPEPLPVRHRQSLVRKRPAQPLPSPRRTHPRRLAQPQRSRNDGIQAQTI